MVRLLVIVLVLLILGLVSLAQEDARLDSLSGHKSPIDSGNAYKFKYKQLVAPVVLMGYGAAGLKCSSVKQLNGWVKEQMDSHAGKQYRFDDYLQYSPAVAVYALNLAGIKGRHSFIDRSAILGTSYLVIALSVRGVKHYTKIRRPDMAAINSFPSGHTATAFMCAEFLRQEYWDQSVWFGISGYLAATATGFMRVYNGRHWLTDVAAGAGIGILGAKVGYWLFPCVRKIYTPKNKDLSAMLIPYAVGESFGAELVVSF
jgi:hypothetical protein